MLKHLANWEKKAEQQETAGKDGKRKQNSNSSTQDKFRFSLTRLFVCLEVSMETTTLFLVFAARLLIKKFVHQKSLSRAVRFTHLAPVIIYKRSSYNTEKLSSPQNFLQSQFRFDNECYLNLPDNHKRVSLMPQTSFDLSIEAPINDDNDDGNGSNVVARTPAAISANESNFNLVYDDFNLASVSMPVLFIYWFLFWLKFVIVCCLLPLIFLRFGDSFFYHQIPPIARIWAQSKHAVFILFPFFHECAEFTFCIMLSPFYLEFM